MKKTYLLWHWLKGLFVEYTLFDLAKDELRDAKAHLYNAQNEYERAHYEIERRKSQIIRLSDFLDKGKKGIA